MDAILDIVDFTGQGIAPALRPAGGIKPVPGIAATPQPKALSAEVQRKVQDLMVVASNAHRQGKVAKVQKALEQVLELNAHDDQALFNLGIILRDAKRHGPAEVMLRRAVKANPEKIEAYHALGDLLYELKHVLSAIKVYENGLEKAPNHLSILANLLRARLAVRHYRDIEALTRRILAIEPGGPDILCYLAWSLLQQGKNLDQALEHVDQALVTAPDHVRSMVVKERLAFAMGNVAMQEAMQAQLLEKARHGAVEDIRHIKELYLWSEETKEATRYLKEYLVAHPDDSEAESALLQMIMSDGDFAGAQPIIEKLVAQMPDKIQLQMSLYLNLFRLGEFDRALPGMECRWGRDLAGGKLDFPVPEWKGEEIRDGKLVIYGEQGVGDHVMYAGHMIPARTRANHIAFEISPRQSSLFQRSFPDFEVIERGALPTNWRMDEVRAKIAAGDLAYVMGEDFRNLPGREGFLIPHPNLLRKLRKKYQAHFPGKLLVGISWRSGNRDSAATRSLELENWLPILKNANCGFVSLQYGDVARDIEDMSELGIDVLMDPSIEPMGNMDPFAAQVAAMDIVVSVDNSTIHYAAGLGKPVWAMLPINCDWRWLTDGDKSIWYDSLRLLRQRKGDSWEQMVENVGRMLADVDAAELHRAHIAMLKRCAETLQTYNRPSENEDYCRMLLEEGACKDIALHGIARAALGVNKPDDAAAILGRALELAPDRAELRADLAVALDAAGEGARAERLARDTIRQFGDSREALSAMGRILLRQGRYDEASDFFARVLRAEPNDIVSRVCLAKLMGAQGEWELARTNYNKALKFAPTSAIAHLGSAEASLRQGNWADGWPEFGWRFGTRPGLLPPHLETIDPKSYPPSWNGAHLKRKRVYLRAERSFAEQLLFAPLLVQAEEEARYLLVECHPELTGMLRPLFPKVEFVAPGSLTPKGLIEKRIQVQTSLGDLAARYRADAVAFKARPPLSLAADPSLAATFAEEYREALPGRRLIGLNWGGGDWSVRRNPADWVALFQTEGVGVVSLQRNATQAELDTLADLGLNMIVDPRGRESLGAHAAQIAAVDAVLAVDDVTTHLAALLGKPVVKPVSRVDHWCWGGSGHPQPWYKNVATVIDQGSGTEELAARAVSAVLAAR